MGRRSCCSKEGLKRGAWTAQEDKILTDYITLHGQGKWRNLPKKAGLKRCGKSCRLRWLNYLRPDIKRGNISSDEEELIIRLHKLLGNRWSLIAGRLPGRTDNEIKNYWNTNLGKKVKDHHQTFPMTPNGKTTTKPQTQLTISNPNLENSHVVHTKPSKCSKLLFINSTSHSSMQSRNKIIEPEPESVKTESSVPSNVLRDDQIKHGMYNNAFSGGEDKGLSADFPIDFNVGDICLLDLLNSDFSNMCDFSFELLSPYLDQAPL